MTLVFDSVRREAVPRALEVRLVLGRTAEALALRLQGVELGDEARASLQQAAELLELAVEGALAQSGSVADRKAQAEVLLALQSHQETSGSDLQFFQSLAEELKAVGAGREQDIDLIAVLERVSRLRHAAASARALPPDERSAQAR